MAQDKVSTSTRSKVVTINEKETMEIKAKVEKDDMKLKGIGTTTVVKTKKEETACVIKVTVATIFATNTSIKMDKSMVDVVKILKVH